MATEPERAERERVAVLGAGIMGAAMARNLVKDWRCDYQGKLAGSVLTLDRAVRNVMSFAGWKLQQAVRLATLNPARLL